MATGEFYFYTGQKYEYGFDNTVIDKNFAKIMYLKAAELKYQPAREKLLAYEIVEKTLT